MAPSAARLLASVAVGLIMASAASAEAGVKVGYAGPLTGSYSSTGHRNRVAVEIAVHVLNTNGGVLGDQVELVVADDRCGIAAAAQAASTLIEAGVEAVIGHVCSHSSLIAAGLYETADILMITPSSTHPRLTEEGRQNVFRLTGRDDDQGQLAADLLARHYGDRRIAIVHDGSTYGRRLAKETRARLRANEVTEVLFETYEPGAEHYASLAARLVAAEVEVLYIGGYGPDAGRILKAARAAGSGLQLVGGDGLSMDEFWAVAEERGEGTIFSAQPRPFGRDGPAAAVLDRFEQRGLGLRAGGLGAYAAVQAWAQAVERAQSSDPHAVLRMLRRGQFETVVGPVSFDWKGDLEDGGWAWHTWTQGMYEPLRMTPVIQ